MERRIKYDAHAVRWFDKVNGNTYHSVRITRCKDGAVIAVPFQYGYGDHYRSTGLDAMEEAGWIPRKYRGRRENGSHNNIMYERENNYPVLWHVTDGLKRECVANGVIS